MIYYPDLTTASMIDAGPHIRAVGWLDDEHEFPTGEPPADFVKKLRMLTRKCVSSVDALGWPVALGCHTCQLCGRFMASLNLGVPAGDLLYVAPEMISHYVEEHAYLPPQPFIDAVLRSPIPGTLGYIRAAARFRNLPSKTMPPWKDPKPGYKWPVRVAQPIAAPAERVWEPISMPGNLEPCHPFCARNPVQKWPGADSRDEVHYLSGWMYERRFERWIEGVGYDLEISRRGGGKSFVSWRIAAVDAGNCVLKITVYPHVLQNLPVAVRWLPHLARLRPMLKSYLSSVVRGFEWYVIRGEPVPRDQFGWHPWFSASRSSAQGD